MKTLKTLFAEIEKKTVSINKVKAFLNTNSNSCIAGELKESLKRYTEDRDSLQLEFDQLYNKFN